MEGFPFGVYGKYGSGESSSQENSTAKLDMKVNRLCKNIANTVIRSRKNREDDEEMEPISFSLPKIPVDVIVFGSIVACKLLLFIAYKAAAKHNMEILDI